MAVTPGARVPSIVTARVLNGVSDSVWVASTCSTSLVPMPNASAPNAPWVEVCESPQTTVMPGWVSPSCGPDDVHDALVAVAEGVQRHPELGAVAPQRVHLDPRHRVRDRQLDVHRRDVVVLGRQGQVRPAHRAAGQPQPVERLRTGDLVHEVQIDVEQVRLALGPAYDVGLPDLLGQRSRHGSLPVRRAILASRRLRRQYRYMDNSSGVGVLDKAAIVLGALEAGPASLASLVAATGLARPTAHRLATALEHHRLVARDLQGRFVLGPRLRELATAAGEDRLLEAANPVLARLRDITGESAQLYRRQGDSRVCVAGAERLTGLRDTVPVGATLTMKAGSAAQILLAWEEPDRLHRGLREAKFTATALSAVRRRGWAQSVGEREAGVASVSAPVRGPGGRVVAAVSVSGPIERLSRQPGRLHAQIVCAAAAKLSEVLQHQQGQQAAGQPRPAGPARPGGPARPAGCPVAAGGDQDRSPARLSRRPLWPRP